jgi:hypothetical protein
MAPQTAAQAIDQSIRTGQAVALPVWDSHDELILVVECSHHMVGTKYTHYTGEQLGRPWRVLLPLQADL